MKIPISRKRHRRVGLALRPLRAICGGPALAMTLLLISATSTPMKGGDREEVSRPSMRGMRTVAVSVDISESPDAPIKLVSDELQTAVELKLRMAGVKISTDYQKVDALVTLAITTGYVAPGYFSRLDLWLDQSVRLRRDTALTCVAKTWSEGYLTYANGGKYLEQVLRYTNLLADKFVNAYLAVNAK